jgi:hypothetical protein
MGTVTSNEPTIALRRRAGLAHSVKTANSTLLDHFAASSLLPLRGCQVAIGAGNHGLMESQQIGERDYDNPSALGIPIMLFSKDLGRGG